MDIDLITVGLKEIIYSLMRNLTAIVFLLGLSFIIYGVFLLSVVAGFISIGVALILISLILVKELKESD